MDRISRAATVILLGACLLAGAGCDEYVAGELATLSGSYVGDVVSVVVTYCVQDAMGIEPAGNGQADEGEHAHDTSALHDHEH
jgi:hypothetical protein